MANIVRIRRSSTPDHKPQALDLEVAELAVNLPDARLYTVDAGGNIIDLTGLREGDPGPIRWDEAYAWGRREQVIYVSDFSAGADGWNTPHSAGTVTGNHDGIGGRDDCLKVDSDTGPFAVMRKSGSLASTGDLVKISADIYLPAASSLDEIIFQQAGSRITAAGAWTLSEADTWMAFEVEFIAVQNITDLRLYGRIAGTVTTQPGEVFYARNVRIAKVSYDRIDVLDAGKLDKDGDASQLTGLTASQIPELPQSKITGLQTALEAKLNASALNDSGTGASDLWSARRITLAAADAAALEYFDLVHTPSGPFPPPLSPNVAGRYFFNGYDTTNRPKYKLVGGAIEAEMVYDGAYESYIVQSGSSVWSGNSDSADTITEFSPEISATGNMSATRYKRPPYPPPPSGFTRTVRNIVEATATYSEAATEKLICTIPANSRILSVEARCDFSDGESYYDGELGPSRAGDTGWTIHSEVGFVFHDTTNSAWGEEAISALQDYSTYPMDLYIYDPSESSSQGNAWVRITIETKV